MSPNQVKVWSFIRSWETQQKSKSLFVTGFYKVYIREIYGSGFSIGMCIQITYTVAYFQHSDSYLIDLGN